MAKEPPEKKLTPIGELLSFYALFNWNYWKGGYVIDMTNMAKKIGR